jgi:hypothetical protein
MDKHVHDPTRNVDRPPRRDERLGSRALERDVQRDRKVERLVDEAIEESFPASDPPAWTVGASVVVEEERDRAGCMDECAERARAAGEPEPARPSRAHGRAKAKQRMDKRKRPPTDDEDTLDMRRDKEQRKEAVQVEQKQEHGAPQQVNLAPERALPRGEEDTDLPGRRNTTEGPHQAFPGEPKVSPPKPVPE